jgi:hypothetical protein
MTEKYFMPDVALTDDDDILTVCTEDSLLDVYTKPMPSASSVRGRTWIILLTSSLVTIVTAGVLVKNTATCFDYLIACSLGLWLGWRF